MTLGYKDFALMNSACYLWAEKLNKKNDAISESVKIDLESITKKLEVFLEEVKEENRTESRFFLAERKIK